MIGVIIGGEEMWELREGLDKISENEDISVVSGSLKLEPNYKMCKVERGNAV